MKRIGIVTALLVILGLLIGSFACATTPLTPTPTSTSSPTPTATPTKPLPSIIRMLGETGSGSFNTGMAVADALSQRLGVKVIPVGQAVSKESLLAFRAKQGDIWATSTGTLDDPVRGKGDFDKPDWGPQSLRTVFEGGADAVSIYTTKKTGIKTFSDLKGRSLAFFPGSATRSKFTEDMLIANGLSWNDVKKVNFDTQEMAQQGVMDGIVDASLSTIPTPKLIELDATVGLVVLPFSRSAEAARIWMVELGRPHVLLEYQKGEIIGIYEDMVLPSTVRGMAAYDWVDEDLIYQITRGIYASLGELQKVTVTADWSAKIAARLPATAAFHPGSIRFFKEVGLWTAEHEKWQQQELQAFQKRLADWKAKQPAAK